MYLFFIYSVKLFSAASHNKKLWKLIKDSTRFICIKTEAASYPLKKEYWYELAKKITNKIKINMEFAAIFKLSKVMSFYQTRLEPLYLTLKFNDFDSKG